MTQSQSFASTLWNVLPRDLLMRDDGNKFVVQGSEKDFN